MLIATVSAKGAPGVSVASLAWTLTWPRPVLLAECEPRGSDFQVGYAHDRAGGGRDLLAVHMNSKRGAAMDAAVREQVLQLGIDESKWLLLGIPEPQQAAAIDWPRLGRTLSNLGGVDVIADCGAVSSMSAPRQVWAAADLVVLLLRSTAASVRSAQLAIPRLRADLNELGMGADRLAAVVVGPGRPYSLGEVKAALRPASVVEGPEIPVVPVIDTLPWDETAAEFLSTGVHRRRGFAGSKLATQAGKSAAVLIEEAERLKAEATAARSFAPRPAFAGVHDLMGKTR
jgi:hypothetical protein